ncbi:hypothetical protein HWV62_36151 [Athelia sp. TMB]|nr:hypothetical protein HWV62_36151 [Athelia sp. TMB]
MSISLAKKYFTSSRQCLRGPLRLRNRWQSSKATASTDTFGIPLKPTWSVNELLSSYPTPTITTATLNHLHKLSALTPPAEGTQEHANLKREMEELVRLVEAVKLADLGGASIGSSLEGEIPDSRIWAEGSGVQPVLAQAHVPGDVGGSDLLQFAARTSDNLYIVDADRRK